MGVLLGFLGGFALWLFVAYLFIHIMMRLFGAISA